MEGVATVVKNAGSHFLLSPLPVWEAFPAVLRGKVRLGRSAATNPVAVGDRVRYGLEGEATLEHPAVIKEVLPRDNYLIRRSTNLSRQAHVIAANLDQAVVVVSLYFPEVKLPFLDRILVTCEVYKVPVLIVLNKVDLYREEAREQLEYLRKIYEGAGYPVLETSARSGEGVEALRERCRGRVNLITGESGVGKSSLIKALDPSLDPQGRTHLRRPPPGKAHHLPLRDVPPRERRLYHRHPGAARLRPGGPGEGGDLQILPRDARRHGPVPIRTLHPHPRTRLRRQGSRG